MKSTEDVHARESRDPGSNPRGIEKLLLCIFHYRRDAVGKTNSIVVCTRFLNGYGYGHRSNLTTYAPCNFINFQIGNNTY